jgi:D-3-phosphoglycerate dehydrogenase
MRPKGMAGLKEYVGKSDEIIDFIGDAEIMVTQLAPLSASMFARLPGSSWWPCRAADRSIST